MEKNTYFIKMANIRFRILTIINGYANKNVLDAVYSCFLCQRFVSAVSEFQNFILTLVRAGLVSDAVTALLNVSFGDKYNTK